MILSLGSLVGCTNPPGERLDGTKLTKCSDGLHVRFEQSFAGRREDRVRQCLDQCHAFSEPLCSIRWIQGEWERKGAWKVWLDGVFADEDSIYQVS